MIGSWLQVTSAEHSRMFHSLIKNKKLMGADSHLFMHYIELTVCHWLVWYNTIDGVFYFSSVWMQKKNSPKHFNLIKEYWIMKLCHHWLLKDIIHKNSELLCGIKENNQLNGCVHHQRSEFDRLIICVYLPKTARTFFHTLAIQASRQRHAEGVFSFTSALRNTITRQWRPPQRNTAAAKLPF